MSSAQNYSVLSSLVDFYCSCPLLPPTDLLSSSTIVPSIYYFGFLNPLFSLFSFVSMDISFCTLSTISSFFSSSSFKSCNALHLLFFAASLSDSSFLHFTLIGFVSCSHVSFSGFVSCVILSFRSSKFYLVSFFLS